MNSKDHHAGSCHSRLYLDEQDLNSMLDILMEGRASTNDWHYAHVGELLFSYFMVVCHFDPQQHIRLWHNEAGKLVGYAILGEDPAFDCQVLPDYEWCGIEDEALAWAEEYLERLRAKDDSLWGGELVSGSRQDDVRRINFLAEHGFIYQGRFAEVNMLRSLSEPIPEADIPTGFRVSSMDVEIDIADRAAAQREVWQPWSVGNVTAEDYTHLMQLPLYNPDLDVVTLSPDGQVAAYVNGWIDPLNRIGDFGPVGARHTYRRQGLTRLALLESLRRMKRHGMDRVCISTGMTNIPAINLYTSIGFVIANKYLDYIKPAEYRAGIITESC